MNTAISKTLGRVSMYTIQVAEAMPEKDYAFKPGQEIWTFRELIHHIAYSLEWMNQQYLHQVNTEWKPTQVPGKKEKIIEMLRIVFDQVKQDTMIQLNEEQLSGFMLLLEHNAHHRGQAVTYLRCAGITPPEFPF